VSVVRVELAFHERFYDEVSGLPWRLDLEDWDGADVRFINRVRKGASRHPVRFVEGGRFNYAIKQTPPEFAKREIENYRRVLALGLHALIPVGYAINKRDPISVETPVGTMYEPDDAAFVVTALEERALPESYLFRLDFREENARMIHDAVAQLFATLHANGVYWGDASMANLLVRFFKVRDERGRVRTELKAVLADAETVEFLPEMSDAMREEELDFFFESMRWMREDLTEEGVRVREATGEKAMRRIRREYERRYRLLKDVERFEEETGLNVRRTFGRVDYSRQLGSLKEQIEEHRWYLGERAGEETAFRTAARDWLENVYKPIVAEFEKLRVFEYFPFTTASRLYLDIMGHKYFMSQEAGEDVGVKTAIVDYAKKFHREEKPKTLLERIGNVVSRFFKTVQKDEDE
jgi:hypothetical protein